MIKVTQVFIAWDLCTIVIRSRETIIYILLWTSKGLKVALSPCGSGQLNTTWSKFGPFLMRSQGILGGFWRRKQLKAI